MSNLNGRVNQLEKANNIHARYKYMCVLHTGFSLDMWDHRQELETKGYKIQPFIESFGGTGEDAFYLRTWDELTAFRARPEVELLLLVVGGGEEIDLETGREIEPNEIQPKGEQIK